MIGIVILNYNHWIDTKECIESIENSKIEQDYRIYLVDNASRVRPSDEIQKFMEDRTEHGGIVFLQSPVNRGYSAGNNLGIRQALKDGCDAVLISNSDVRYYDKSIDSLYEYLKTYSDVGIVGPKIHLPGGLIQKECMAGKTGMKEKYLLRTRLHVFFPRLNRSYWAREHDYEAGIFQVYAVLGCCFMMSRACALDVTPLDEETFLYEEELILGIRMEEKGWKTVYDSGSEIFHKHEVTTGGIGKNPFAYTSQICSELYYCRKYLKASHLQLLPLYGYRVFIYLLKMRKNREFRSYWKEFQRKTTDAFRQSLSLKESAGCD